MPEPDYFIAIKKHLDKCLKNLDLLYTIRQERELQLFEYLAAERLLQTMVEGIIGYAKQLVKAKTQQLPENAYDAFIILHQHGMLSLNGLSLMKQVIGLRNTLVHDYLNIEPHVINDVIQNRRDLDIFHLLDQA